VAFTTRDHEGNSQLEGPAEIAPTLNAAFSDKQGLENQHINGGAGWFVPTVAYPINSMNAFRSPDAAPSTGLGVGHDGEAMYTLTKGNHHAIAFSSNMSVPDCQTDGTTPTLKLGGHGGGNPPAVAYAIQDSRPIEKAQNGRGWNADGSAYTIDTQGNQGVAYSFKPGQSEAAGGVFVTEEYSPTLQAANNGSTAVPAVAYEPAIAWSEELTASVDLAGTIQRGGSGGRHDGVMVPAQAVAYLEKQKPLDPYLGGEVTIAIDASYSKGCGGTSAAERPVVASNSTVRRLTPVECERLQGFPDNFTAIPWRKKGAEDCPDGPRYKALGNSMAVPVMRWIGERINLIDDYLSII
jgi:DNA (cytosine-5)-methyltransferase 1